jgi:hypothetical protein
MGVTELRKLGITANQIADGVSRLNSFNNETDGTVYDALLTRARTLTGNQELLLSDLTDAQINNGLLEGRGTVDDIAETKAYLNTLETTIVALRSKIDTLPQVND